jgi:Cu/Ag efflux pump CusA
MISRLIRESFHAPLLTALLVTAGAVIGAFWMQDLRRDVFPDLSAPVFNVIAQNPAMGGPQARLSTEERSWPLHRARPLLKRCHTLRRPNHGVRHRLWVRRLVRVAWPED